MLRRKGNGTSVRTRVRVWASVLPIVLLLMGFFLFLRVGYLPVVGNRLAERGLNHYQEQLGCPPLTGTVRFNWYNSCYAVYEGGNRSMQYDLRRDLVTDFERMTEEQTRLEADFPRLQAAMPDNILLPEHPRIFTEYSGRDPTQRVQTLYLLSIWNTGNLTPEESETQPARLATEVIGLLGDAYSIRGIQVAYFDRNGGYTIWISQEDDGTLTYEGLRRQTEQWSEEELPEDYRLWREQFIPIS